MIESAFNHSISTLSRSLIKFISNHPLIINPPVYHPLTGEQIKINRYRSYFGLDYNGGLTCSVSPYPGDGAIPNPRTSSVTAMYESYNLGENIDHAVYHLFITYTTDGLTIGNTTLDNNLIEVPVDAITDPKQYLLTSNTTKNIELEIHPAIDIISDYLDLTRYVISDQVHKQKFLFNVTSLEAVYANISSRRWEDDLNVYFHEGTLMVRFDAYVSRGWRDKFLNPIKSFNIAFDSSN